MSLRNSKSYKTLEAELEKRLVDKVTNLGGLAWKFTSQGTIGVPDRIIMFCGKIFFVEMKAPGKDLREIQQWRKHQLEREGFTVLRLRTKEEVDEFVDSLVHAEIQSQRESERRIAEIFGAKREGDWNAI
ncbi:VRR-NUC domain-containing protein [Holdemania massiliensis]|uniref:VRR-NUC domain-containing protein n=1 Tax=Holdemania massiliensis TaxID=1468449 RepID=UPI0026757243|nr:VRR-NUC domain-containing protein [Holdemania massiliensis]